MSGNQAPLPPSSHPPGRDDGLALIVGPAQSMDLEVGSGQAGRHGIRRLQAQAVNLQASEASGGAGSQRSVSHFKLAWAWLLMYHPVRLPAYRLMLFCTSSCPAWRAPAAPLAGSKPACCMDATAEGS
jgi:hypothetical protein